MEEFVYTLRTTYATGKATPSAILHCLGLEEKHSRKLTQLLRGERYPEFGGPSSIVDFNGLIDFIPSIRAGYGGGLSIEVLSRQYQYPPIVIRKVLSGEYAKYVAGPIFPGLRDRPNDASLLLRLKDTYTEEVDRFFNPYKYVDRPDPVWLNDEDEDNGYAEYQYGEV